MYVDDSLKIQVVCVLISFGIASLALGQSYDTPDKYGLNR